MMTLRRYLTAQYDWTGLASRICRSAAWEMAALAMVAVLVLLLAIFYHVYIAQLPWAIFASPTGLEHMFNKITYFTWTVFLIPAFFVLSHAFRMFRLTMRRSEGTGIPLRLYLEEAKALFLHMVTHIQILKCTDRIHRKRWAKHWLGGRCLQK